MRCGILGMIGGVGVAMWERGEGWDAVITANVIRVKGGISIA